MSPTVAEFNAGRPFPIEFAESRLKKCINLISRLPVGRMLDIGCATGEWMQYWQSHHWLVSGVEVNQTAVQQAQQALLDVHHCDLTQEQLPFHDETFDLIFAGEVIEHLVDTDNLLQDIYRCLKPGGHAVLTTPNLASFENRIRLLLGKYPRWLDYHLANCGHVRGYTAPVLKKQLQQHGFRIITHLGNWIPFLPQSLIDDIKVPWLALTGNLYPNWAAAIILLVQK